MTTSSASSATPQANSRTRLLGLGALAVALVLTVACAATAVFAVIADSRHRDSYKQDQALVALLKADFQMDRALYTELQAIISGLTTKVPADEGPLNAAATELGACAKDFGIDNLKLTDSEADQQVRLLFEDPAARVQGARDEIDRGTIDGTKLPATFATLRAAVYTFAEKAPSLFNSPSLAEISQDYAEGANPERTSPPRIDQEVDPLDVRVRTLDLLTKFSEAVDQSGPRALWLASAIAGALAAGAWALVFAQRKAWAIGASLKNLGQSVKPAAKPATKESAAKPAAATTKPGKAATPAKPAAKATAPGASPAGGARAPATKAPATKPTTAAPTAKPAATPGIKPAATTPGTKPAAARPATPGVKPATAGQPAAGAAPAKPAATRPGSAAPGARPAAGTPAATPRAAGTKPATPATPAAKAPGATGPIDAAAMAAATRNRPAVPFQPTSTAAKSEPTAPATPTTKPGEKPPAAGTPAPKKTPKVPWRTTGEK